MSRFHKVRIKSINKETHDCVTVALDVPEELKDTFRYTQGQYLTFRRDINGEELRRSYSICSSPLENEWRVAIKKVPAGRFSGYANESLQVGEELEVMPPMGRFFTELNPANQKQYVAFAAGSGITPVFSIIKTILMTEPHSQVSLIYGNRGRNSIIFKEAIEGLKNKYLDRLSVYHVLSREQGEAELLFGRIDKQKAQLFLQKLIKPEEIDECFICGPEEMIFGVKDALTEAGVATRKIHYELFTTGESGQKNKAAKERPAGEDDKMSQVTVKLDGAVLNMEMSYYGKTILDAAIDRGADLPYSCKGGVCSTCRARVTEGEVEMDVNYSLEPDEVQAGYVLTCQSRPLTEKVVVDFDQ
ncbi:ring-1,2-phenylacetyl-CoA epoxidase subunit PaaE [Pontibacter ummariensis]|uniref:Ring-1,2-phenylacetyl-CoA epoxidase subunit PaaE n=1 Tax=Pontibacter ummariensis TaxID=1610492 RepID=A0A239KXL6_9BACT|nr:1,2-phenylacetyl-CoA epoxidase subunit PaaE [Pontibacter ummariensis]PRY04665.1 ring-1,2-phenylacetyl-CoA epoxidase subunit PaaE [Pontibacter ummariensis]SNT23107.1 ring-1,2-phenylacetyl-CoA epoxidase subunit PaaE [Pontibacter ummariensis]